MSLAISSGSWSDPTPLDEGEDNCSIDLADLPRLTAPYSHSTEQVAVVNVVELNPVYTNIKNIGNHWLAELNTLEEVSAALSNLGDVRNYYFRNLNSNERGEGNVFAAIWNDPKDNGEVIHVLSCRRCEGQAAGEYQTTIHELHPGQVLVWDPKDVEMSTIADIRPVSFTVLVSAQRLAAAEEYLTERKQGHPKSPPKRFG